MKQQKLESSASQDSTIQAALALTLESIEQVNIWISGGGVEKDKKREVPYHNFKII